MSVTCLDAETGNRLWSTRLKRDGGNNSTPTVADGWLYVLGYRGQAFCLDVRSGELRWKQDPRIRGDQEPGWGHAGSPFLWEELVICNVGAGAALHRETGEIVWQHSGQGGYATPVLFTLKGTTGVAIFHGTGLAARDPRSGKELWSIPWPTDRAVNACDPIFIGDKVLISTTYGKGAALFDLAGSEPKQVWYEEKLGSSYRTGIYWKGCVYGNARRKPVCYDYATGHVRWEERRKEGGFALLADEKLIYLTGDGLLIIAKPTPDGLTPIVEAQLLEGTTWAPPALCRGKVYVRNEAGDLACWQVALRK
jgi:outer membrane protein assembly factor BamB